MPQPLRFTDILTNAAAIATLLGDDDVTARHLGQAVQLLRDEVTVDQLGKPRSPLGRETAQGPRVSPQLQAFVQLWYRELGFAPLAMIDGEQLARFLREAAALETEAGGDANAS